MNQENQFEIIIIGGSYSGLAAGMALGRAMRKVLIIDSGKPCNRQTPHSHNFLSNDGKAPKEISGIAKEEVQAYSTVSFIDDTVTHAQRTSGGFKVQTQTGKTLSARKLIFATGIKDLMPHTPGLAQCWGISVLHCPYCHGYEVRYQKTGILGNGDTAYELAALISNWTKDLTVYTNGESTLTSEQTAKLSKHNIEIVAKEIANLEHNNGYLQNILFRDGSKSPVKAMYARLPFEQNSNVPQALGCELTNDGYLQIDAAYRTTAEGIYASGDNTTRLRTVANSVSMGTTTGMMLNK
jgi:thioredoxin reductase